jgi:hypothetical protein
MLPHRAIAGLPAGRSATEIGGVAQLARHTLILDRSQSLQLCRRAARSQLLIDGVREGSLSIRCALGATRPRLHTKFVLQKRAGMAAHSRAHALATGSGRHRHQSRQTITRPNGRASPRRGSRPPLIGAIVWLLAGARPEDAAGEIRQ